MELGLQLPVVLKPLGLHHEPQALMPESVFRRSRLKKARPSLESASRGETDKPILSISYEQSLLLTREMLLSDAGFEETSARTHRDALECCRKSKFDLIIVGHSIPKNDKQEVGQADQTIEFGSGTLNTATRRRAVARSNLFG